MLQESRCQPSLRAVDWVPRIDLSDAAAPVEIGDACARVGFLTVVGHGVPQTVLDGAWSTAERFFALPLEQKMAVAMPRPGYPYGYSPIAGETLAASLGNRSHPDLKESFAIGPVDPATHSFADADEEFAWSPNGCQVIRASHFPQTTLIALLNYLNIPWLSTQRPIDTHPT